VTKGGWGPILGQNRVTSFIDGHAVISSKLRDLFRKKIGFFKVTVLTAE
jgi:hypothetical protein